MLHAASFACCFLSLLLPFCCPPACPGGARKKQGCGYKGPLAKAPSPAPLLYIRGCLRSLLLARGLLTRAPPSKGPLPSPSLLLAAFPSALSLAGAWPLGACLGPGSPRPLAKFGKFWARWVSSLEAISQNWAQGASKDRAFSLQLKNNFL